MEKFRSASVPHIKFELPRKPFPHFSIHTRVLQCGWKHSGKFAFFFSALIILSILIPYTFALIGGNSRPLLPLIRQNESDITQSGICSVALYFIAIIGSVMISVRYVHVSSQNETKNWRLNVLNKLGLSIGYVSFSGLVVVASFPVRMDPGKQLLWDPSVLLLPLMGAFFTFFFGALYLLLQTAISLFFYEGNGRLVLLRFVFFIICSTCFATSTLSTMFMDKKPPSDGSIHLIESDVMTKFISEPNVMSSLSEWLMVLFFALYFLTFVRESESISVAITFRHLLTGRRISLASLTNMSQI